MFLALAGGFLTTGPLGKSYMVSFIYGILRKKKNVEHLENRMVVARGWEMEEIRDFGKRVQTFSYKKNKFWGPNVKHGGGEGEKEAQEKGNTCII